MPNAFLADMTLTGSAKADLAGGFGGQQLQNQVQDETDEERKKRLKLISQQQGGNTALNAGSIFGGLAAPALFGNYGR